MAYMQTMSESVIRGHEVLNASSRLSQAVGQQTGQASLSCTIIHLKNSSITPIPKLEGTHSCLAPFPPAPSTPNLPGSLLPTPAHLHSPFKTMDMTQYSSSSTSAAPDCSFLVRDRRRCLPTQGPPQVRQHTSKTQPQTQAHSHSHSHSWHTPGRCIPPRGRPG